MDPNSVGFGFEVGDAQIHRRRKIDKIEGAKQAPRGPPTSNSNMKYTIVNIITGVPGAESPEGSGFSQNSD